jgi:D-3-phosphoglycerate dehydrogenase
MSIKVLVTPRSFAKTSSRPLDMLAERKFEIVRNPYGRILSKQEMIELIADVDAIIVGVDPLDRDVLAHARKLKVISKYGVGLDNVDLDYARDRGIRVAAALGANVEAVADYTLALMLAVARKVIPIDRACRRFDWSKPTTLDVYGRTLGIVGLGSIGRAVAERARGFRMNVLAYDVRQDEAYAAEHGIEYVPLEELLRRSDFISLHSPLTGDNRHLIGEEQLALMKPTAVLINTARGGLIDEQALFRALKENRIWGAGIDVFEQEPPSNRELLELDNIVIGSHCAASTVQAVENMGIMAAENVIRNLPGEGCA